MPFAYGPPKFLLFLPVVITFPNPPSKSWKSENPEGPGDGPIVTPFLVYESVSKCSCKSFLIVFLD